MEVTVSFTRHRPRKGEKSSVSRRKSTFKDSEAGRVLRMFSKSRKALYGKMKLALSAMGRL